MADFPTLSKGPVYPLQDALEDNIIRSPLEAGYQHTRPRHTKPREGIPIRYADMTPTDVSTLKTFEKGDGQGAFNWTHPDSTVYVMKFAGPVNYVLVELDRYEISFALREV